MNKIDVNSLKLNKLNNANYYYSQGYYYNFGYLCYKKLNDSIYDEVYLQL